MSTPSSSTTKELLNQLKEKTKETIKLLTEKGSIYKEDQLQKNYSINKPMEYLINGVKKAIPLNIIYHVLYDQETPCQKSKGKLIFSRHFFLFIKIMILNMKKKH